MSQQTHPHETTSGTDEPREPLWYHGASERQGTREDTGDTTGDGTAKATAPTGDGAGQPLGDGPTPYVHPWETRPTSDTDAYGLESQAGTQTPTREVPTTWSQPTTEPGTTSATAGPSAYGASYPEAPSTPQTSSGWDGGGWGGPSAFQPSAPAPAPKTRRGLGVAGVVGVAVLAALVGGGAAITTVHYTGAGSSTISTTTSQQAPVVQAAANAPDWVATAKAVAPSVVSITVTSQSAEGQGSGVIIDSQGHILTNNHVATGAGTGAQITVTLNDGRTYDATIVGTDATTDLAVLKLSNGPSDLTPISIGDSSSLTVGQPVMAIGNPLGLSGTVTTGIVSALNRPVATQAESQGQGQGQSGDATAAQVVTNAIQTSAAINPGNSGGALVTANGQLIGINSSIASLSSSSSGSQSGSIGIGFAIPVKEAKSIADQLIQNGTAQHAYLGVSAQDTTVTDGGSKRAAAIIRSVSAGTPAANAGLKVGDAVIAIDGQSIESSESLVGTIHGDNVGDKVTVTVIRGGAKQDISVTLAARPGQG